MRFKVRDAKCVNNFAVIFIFISFLLVLVVTSFRRSLRYACQRPMFCLLLANMNASERVSHLSSAQASFVMSFCFLHLFNKVSLSHVFSSIRFEHQRDSEHTCTHARNHTRVVIEYNAVFESGPSLMFCSNNVLCRCEC